MDNKSIFTCISMRVNKRVTKLLLLQLLLLSAFQGMAANRLPLDKSSVYITSTNREGWDFYDYKSTWVGDIIFNGNSYKKIYRTSDTAIAEIGSYYGAVREDTVLGKTYFLDESNVEYDVTVPDTIKAGDTILISSKLLDLFGYDPKAFLDSNSPDSGYAVVQAKEVINDRGFPETSLSIISPTGYQFSYVLGHYITTAFTLGESKGLHCHEISDQENTNWNTPGSVPKCDIQQFIVSANEVLLSEDAVQLSPNPTSGIIRISTNEIPSQVVLRNASGEMVYSSAIENNFEIDLTGLSNGLYFTELTFEQGVYRKMIIKK